MGRFYLHNGDLRPSDDYLASHELPDYEPGDDWFNDSYDVEDDPTVLYEQRTCEKCGKTFNLYDAMSEYADRISWPDYGYECAGEYCGNCAADIMDEKFQSGDE